MEALISAFGLFIIAPILYFLYLKHFGCIHKWTEINQKEIYHSFFQAHNNGKIVIGYVFNMRCEKCGVCKTITTKYDN